jgi:hypothetical protein
MENIRKYLSGVEQLNLKQEFSKFDHNRKGKNLM